MVTWKLQHLNMHNEEMLSEDFWDKDLSKLFVGKRVILYFIFYLFLTTSFYIYILSFHGIRFQKHASQGDKCKSWLLKLIRQKLFLLLAIWICVGWLEFVGKCGGDFMTITSVLTMLLGTWIGYFTENVWGSPLSEKWLCGDNRQKFRSSIIVDDKIT